MAKYYLRQIYYPCGNKEETPYELAICASKYNNLRCYIDTYPEPRLEEMSIFFFDTIEQAIKMRLSFKYCNKHFDIYDDNGKVDIESNS